MNTKIFALVSSLVFFGAGCLDSVQPPITNYAECVAAGYSAPASLGECRVNQKVFKKTDPVAATSTVPNATTRW